MISRYRPEAKIIALTPKKDCFRQLNIVWGVTPVLIDPYDNADQIQGIATKVLSEKGLIAPNDRFVVTGGVPVGVSGTTNYLSVIKTS
jgi:pyruvate kinase